MNITPEQLREIAQRVVAEFHKLQAEPAKEQSVGYLCEDGYFIAAHGGVPRYTPLFLRPAPDLAAKVGENWLPTSENINALPEPVRLYIASVETMCDPSGIIRENTILQDMVRGLEAMVTELATQNKAMREALEKAFEFMRSGTAEECPDKVYIPTYEALNLPNLATDILRGHVTGSKVEAAINPGAEKS